MAESPCLRRSMNYCESCGNVYLGEKKAFPKDFFLEEVFQPSALVDFTLEGKYKIEELIAVGKTSSVFRARHTFINNDLAIKILHPTLVQNSTTAFLHQARTLAILNHPNIAKCIDFGQIENLHYSVMEFIKGHPLNNCKSSLSLRQIGQVMDQLCAALAIAHKYNISHQDLTADNIMLFQDENLDMHIKVLNFRGIKVISTTSDVQEIAMFATAQTSNVLAQTRPATIDFKSDIQSLAIIAFGLFTLPLPILTHSDLTEQVRKLPDLQLMNSGIPAEIEHILLRALEEDPNKTFCSVSEFAFELTTAISKKVKFCFTTPKVDLPKPQIIKIFDSKTPSPQILEDFDKPSSTIDYELPRVSDIEGEAKFIKPEIANTHKNLTLSQKNDFVPKTKNSDKNVNNPGDISSAETLTNKPIQIIKTQTTSTIVKPKLLLVINSTSIIMIIEKYMKRCGFEVIVVTESLQAVAAIFKNQPDIIVLGLDLPKLDGGNLCRIIKTDPAAAKIAHIPVFLFSSLEEDKLQRKVKLCKADGYIHKTWKIEEVAEIINNNRKP